jgi:group II intron reverse transcriptase/maturase
VLDADIRDFFGTLDHGWLVKFIEHRVADRRVVRLIQKWLKAGVLEDGEWKESEVGTVQGGGVSPILANIYLHYAFDLWVQWWRRHEASGDVIVVRYADDFIVGFQHRHDAERFLEALRDRLAKFRLELHPDKTRLLEFGRFAVRNRKRRGLGKPETFDFLGFTHICGSTKRGWFTVRRQTMRKRLQAKLKDVKQELRRRMHSPVKQQGAYLRSVVTGHLNYYGVPMNTKAIGVFRMSVGRHWRAVLRHRSQRARVPWPEMKKLIDRWLPPVRVCHPYPLVRMGVIT